MTTYISRSAFNAQTDDIAERVTKMGLTGEAWQEEAHRLLIAHGFRPVNRRCEYPNNAEFGHDFACGYDKVAR